MTQPLLGAAELFTSALSARLSALLPPPSVSSAQMSAFPSGPQTNTYNSLRGHILSEVQNRSHRSPASPGSGLDVTHSVLRSRLLNFS